MLTMSRRLSAHAVLIVSIPKLDGEQFRLLHCEPQEDRLTGLDTEGVCIVPANERAWLIADYRNAFIYPMSWQGVHAGCGLHRRANAAGSLRQRDR
jgi:hypothetical protein